ncbi:MAG: helix-turn-helix transcriptional regulator [Thermomicrobiales bacterium]
MTTQEQRDQFAEWLQRQIDQRGWTAADFARAAGMQNGRVSEYLRAKYVPGPVLAKRIADALDILPTTVLIEAGRFEDDDLFDPQGDQRELVDMLTRVNLDDPRRVALIRNFLSGFIEYDEDEDD